MTPITYSDILRAVYHTMADGKQYKAKDLLPLVKEACGYTDDQMKEMTKEGNSPKVEKNVRWAITHLFGAGLIWRVKRGVYEIIPQKDKLLSLDGKDLENLVRTIAKSRETDTEKNVLLTNEAIDKAKKQFPKLSDDNYDWMISELGFMDTAPDRATINKGIRSLIVDAEEEMSIDDLKELLKEAIELRSIKYELDVKIQNKGNKRDPKIIVDFDVKDNKGNKYPLKLETFWKAIYLTFLYFEDRISLRDFCDSKNKPNQVFQKIYDMFYNKKGAASVITYEDATDFEKSDLATAKLTWYISKIRTSIAESLPNDRVARQFVISKDDELCYTILASNQDIRDCIKKNFSLK